MKKTKRRPWNEDLKTLKALAKQGLTGTAIAKKLKRSRGATYHKASIEGIRFKSR
jgi:hypothetical protein